MPQVEVGCHGAWMDRAEFQMCGHLAGSAEIRPVAVLRIVLQAVLDEPCPLVTAAVSPAAQACTPGSGICTGRADLSDKSAGSSQCPGMC